MYDILPICYWVGSNGWIGEGGQWWFREYYKIVIPEFITIIPSFYKNQYIF